MNYRHNSGKWDWNQLFQADNDQLYRVSCPADAGSLLMGARGYLSRRYSYVGGSVTAAPEHVISAYRKLVTRGLFTLDKGNGHDR